MFVFLPTLVNSAKVPASSSGVGLGYSQHPEGIVYVKSSMPKRRFVMSNDEVIRDFRVAPIIRRAAQLSVLLSMFVASALAQRAPNVVIQWNQAALQGVRDGTLGPPMVARALAIVHTCMYDAWAAYDRKATGTQLGGGLRTLPAMRTHANKREAISFAAYRAAVELFAWDKATVFDPLMAKLGYDVDDTSTDTRTPAGIGNVACAAVLAFRHTDGSNQLGDLTASGIPYADYTGYQPKNLPSTVPVTDLSTVLDPNRWQPLTYFNGTKVVTPVFVGAQWYKVTPFAMISPDQFLPFVRCMVRPCTDCQNTPSKHKN